MKRVVAAAGACAIGSAGLHAANITGLTPQEQSKWWILSASLSSFYDDNVNNSPSSIGSGTNRVDTKEGSLGFDFTPGVAVNLPGDQTLLSASYDWELSYYTDRPQQKLDQTHRFNLGVHHKFSERYSLEVTDTFSKSDEPAIRQGESSTVFGRLDTSNIRNLAKIEYSAVLSPVIGLLAGYSHDLQDYDNESYSRTLDRVENAFHIDGRWFRSQQTMLFCGYRVGLADYTGPKLTAEVLTHTNGFETIVLARPSIKNNVAHRLYVGVNQDLSSQLEVQGAVGVEYTDYYNFGESSSGPYAATSATYTYRRDSTLTLGVNVGRYPTDSQLANEESVTLDQLVYAVSFGINHRFSERISAHAQFNYQHAIFNGGDEDGLSDDYYTLNLGSEYKIREYLWATAGYTFNNLRSGRTAAELISFTKNIISFGIRATY